MENSSFHSQLLSVMDVLAQAAAAEINRCVDEGCAVLRLEVSQSRRDIDLLRRKCEVMEAELRRTRLRTRRRGFYPPAADRFPPLVRIVLNKETQSSDWDRQMEAEAQTQPLKRAETQPVTEADHIQIKVESAEGDTWKNHPEDKMKSEEEQPSCFEASPPPHSEDFSEPHHSAENPADSESLMSPTNDYNTLQDQQLCPSQSETELMVKLEREEEQLNHEDTATHDSTGNFVTDGGSGQLWVSNPWTDAADPSSSFAEQQFPPVFQSQSGLDLEDVVPDVQSLEKSHAVGSSAARQKRRARTFGSQRPQQDGGHNASSQFHTMDHCSVSLQSQHPYRNTLPHTGHQNEDLMPQIPAPASSLGPSRSSSFLAKKMRTPWRSSLGEKKFSCTYCLKLFSKHCQLREHLRSHTGERPYSCKLCGRSFAKQCNLIRHAVVHSGEKPHECSLCGKCFTQRSSLKSHQKSAH
ncbi:zinc finger protein 436 [Xyrichtys novacula]|uniref:Zinc finger protein 436 n=1 Tax=Xyrichtys novacula TaxID=13765 RepID=A0AAV1GI76_XYRNO|nr:zinc finger protein 436 [Xyrichtys novacula]